MAKRHFDERGFPNLELIASEICDFSGEESYRTIARLAQLLGSDGFADEQLEFAINYLGLFGQFVPTLPTIDEIYVIGSQARHLPDSYLTGNHDLDLVIRTTPSESVDADPIVQRFTLRELLRYFLNDPTKQVERPDCEEVASKQFRIDVYDETMVDGLKEPNLNIYPTQ